MFPLLEKNLDSVTIDWVLVALVRPEVLSNDAAIILSFLGYLYSGMIYWFFFSGLLFLYAISGDYSEICAARETDDQQTFQRHVAATGMTIMTSVFRCTILGLLMALTITMHAAYPVSDAEGIISWMIHDASTAFGLRTDGWTWIKDSPSSFFTSFLLLFLICFVFGACIWPVKSASDDSVHDVQEKRHITRMMFCMTSVIAVLAAGHLLIGQLYGFSIVLALSIDVSLASLFWKMKPLANETQGVSVSWNKPPYITAFRSPQILVSHTDSIPKTVCGCASDSGHRSNQAVARCYSFQVVETTLNSMVTR